jgi:hypothetical protein
MAIAPKQSTSKLIAKYTVYRVVYLLVLIEFVYRVDNFCRTSFCRQPVCLLYSHETLVKHWLAPCLLLSQKQGRKVIEIYECVTEMTHTHTHTLSFLPWPFITYVCMFPFQKSVIDKVICGYIYVVEFLEDGIKLWKNETMAVRITVLQTKWSLEDSPPPERFPTLVWYVFVMFETKLPRLNIMRRNYVKHWHIFWTIIT